MVRLVCSFKYFRHNYYHFTTDFQKIEEGRLHSLFYEAIATMILKLVKDTGKESYR